jgi:hypothetical protein
MSNLRKMVRTGFFSIFLLGMVVSGAFVVTSEAQAQMTCAAVPVVVTSGAGACPVSTNVPALSSVSNWATAGLSTYTVNCSYPAAGSLPTCEWACINGTLTSRDIASWGSPVCPVGPHPIAPTVTLDPFILPTITAGQSSTISFSSTNATACTGIGVLSGSLGTSAANAPTGVMNTPGVYTQSVTCTGAGGSATSVTRTLTVTSPTYACTGALPANATTYAGDDAGLSVDTARAFAAANTAEKCQYACNTSYTWDGSACVLPVTPINGACAATHYSCTAGISANTVSGAASYTWNCNGTSGGTNASCSEVKPTGTVVVTSNIPASWTITGPAVIAGAGTIQTSVSKPVGVYTITWGAVSGYATPAPSSLTLVDGGTVSFNGMYTPASCSAGTTLNWSVGGNTCTGTTPATNSGLSGAITDSTLPTTGSAAFSCTNGAWAAMPNAGATCGTQPDLTATNVTPAAASSFLNNAAITFTGTAINSAAAAVAQGGWADLEIDWHSDSATFDTNRNAYSNVQLGAFAVNQTKPLSYTLAAGAAPAGTHRYRFNVDTTNTLGESNETNNQSAWVTFSVIAASPSIDLTVAGCSILAGADECATALTTWNSINATPDYQIKNDTTGDIIYTGANGNSSAAGTRLTYGPNTIYGYHNNDFAVGNHIGSFTADADCVSGAEWSGITNRCELAPSLTITANPNLIRYDSSTSVTVTTTSTNPLTCGIYGATIAPETNIMLGPLTTLTHTIPNTRNIKAKQQVLVECVDTVTGLTGTAETYIEVLPKIQEV